MTDARPLRVAIVTNVVPHYRVAFYERLIRRGDMEVRIFCQRSLPGSNLELHHDRLEERVTLVPFVGLGGERLGWQRLPWRRLLSSFDVLFVLGNPRVVSNLVLATLARAMGKRVVIVGQAHTAGANPLTERMRLWWWRRFDHL